MRGHWKNICPSSGIPKGRERHTRCSTGWGLAVWGRQENLMNTVILATWRISEYLSGQQLGYSYMWGFVVIHLQLSISYLSNPKCLITCSWSVQLFLSLSQRHLSSPKGRREGKLWQQWRKGPQHLPSVSPTSYCPYSSTTEDNWEALKVNLTFRLQIWKDAKA